MKYEEIFAVLEKEISPARFAHIKGVVKAAVMLAERYNGNAKKAAMAALLHDCCKEYPYTQLKQTLVEAKDSLATDEFLEYRPLLHGPAGAIIAKKKFGVKDAKILEAIRVHTTGKVGMNKLDKIIFLADYIEETRNFPGVDVLREKALQNLNEAVLAGYDSTIRVLLEQGRPIYEGTISGRNDILHIVRNQ